MRRKRLQRMLRFQGDDALMVGKVGTSSFEEQVLAGFNLAAAPELVERSIDELG